MLTLRNSRHYRALGLMGKGCKHHGCNCTEGSERMRQLEALKRGRTEEEPRARPCLGQSSVEILRYSEHVLSMCSTVHSQESAS